MKYKPRNIRKCNSASNYILKFGKLFYIYKLIHIDLNPRILRPLAFESSFIINRHM